MEYIRRCLKYIALQVILTTFVGIQYSGFKNVLKESRPIGVINKHVSNQFY